MGSKKKAVKRKISWSENYAILKERCDSLLYERDTLLANNHAQEELIERLHNSVSYYKEQHSLALTIKHLKECEGLG